MKADSRELLGGTSSVDLQVLAACLPFTVVYDVCLAVTRGFGTVVAATLLENIYRAVNIALVLRRPLLVKGPPGCGKTRLAEAIAHYALNATQGEAIMHHTFHDYELLRGGLAGRQFRTGYHRCQRIQQMVFGLFGDVGGQGAQSWTFLEASFEKR